MLEFDVLPEHGLVSDGLEFILGMHIGQIVASIQKYAGQVKDVDLIYNESDPLSMDILLKLTRDGIQLIFDTVYQRLKQIEIYNLTLVRLKYCDTLFNCPEVTPTLDQIDHCFGATHPGLFDANANIYTLKFRGLNFEFVTEKNLQNLLGCQESTPSREIAKEREVMRHPRVDRILIYHAPSSSQSTRPHDSFRGYTPVGGDSMPKLTPYNEGVVEILSDLPSATVYGVRIDRAIETVGADPVTPPPPNCSDVTNLDLRSRTPTERCSRTILFGDAVQDVLSVIGSPGGVFYKSEDKMKIHSSNAERLLAETKSDYFYNYFDLGMDILFDATSNTVKKFVLHTNFPGHYNFNMYRRCQFNLSLPTSGSNKTNAKQGVNGKGKAHPSVSSTSIKVTAFSKWSEISDHVIGKCDEAKSPCTNCQQCQRPVILNRASSANTTNPFGPTFCYGYRHPLATCDAPKRDDALEIGGNMIFEVMNNGHLASVVVYSAKKSPSQDRNNAKYSSQTAKGRYNGCRHFLADGQLVRC